MPTGKQTKIAKGKVDRSQAYPVEEALALVKDASFAKFDETVEMAIRLGVDPRKADQMVRGAVVLPNGLGKTLRVLVFAKGEKAQEATDAGADFVGGDDLVAKIQGGWYDFDTAIATPDMMGTVGKIGRLLGPRGLMPNPKSGTVTQDVAKTVTEFKAGKIEYRNDRYGNVHAPVGKASFELDQLVGNLASLTAEVIRAKPAGAKGRYLEAMTMSSTMGPGVKVDVGHIDDLTELAQ